MKLTPDAVIKTIQDVIPGAKLPVALHEPFFDGNEWNYTKECLDSGWVSSAGPYVEKFEKALADFTGVKHAVAVVNGTAALHVCLKLGGVEAGDEVLIPALTFVATANAVTYCGGIPHFVDCDEETLGLDPKRLEKYLKENVEVRANTAVNRHTGRRIRALLPMHVFGHPANLDALADLARRYHLVFLEDTAESLGSYYKDRHTGHWGLLSALSFNGNKIVTTGGGGAILTNDTDLARAAKHITTTAKTLHAWNFFHDQIGYNYRLPNLNAALGVAQMEGLNARLKNKRKLAERYQEHFSKLQGLRVFKESNQSRSNYWLNALILDEEYAPLRDEILEHAHAKALYLRPSWVAMHRLPMYADCPRMDLFVTDSLERRIINLPSSAFL